jgi:hypothetical protein
MRNVALADTKYSTAQFPMSQRGVLDHIPPCLSGLHLLLVTLLAIMLVKASGTTYAKGGL